MHDATTTDEIQPQPWDPELTADAIADASPEPHPDACNCW